MKSQLINKLLTLESSGLNSLEHTPEDWEQEIRYLQSLPIEQIEELINQFKQ